MSTRLETDSQDAQLRGHSALADHSDSNRYQLYEYAYYLILFYGVVNTTIGILIPYLTTVSLFGLALLCLLRRRLGVLAVIRPILGTLLCIASLVLIQKFIHGVGSSDLIPFAAWGATLIVIQSLSTRPGFLFRLTFVSFATGVTLLPYMNLRGTSDRFGLATGSAISNPNNLSAWFGFCAVYFLIRSLQSKRFLDQVMSGAITFISLIVVGLTVSRGALLGLALAAIVIFRKQLKRGFVPLLVVTILAGAGLVSGAFDSTISHYTKRGAEETGRGAVFIPALLRIEESPIVGVGLSNIGTPTPDGEVRLPHDSLLFFALASGIVPLFFFVVYCVSTIRTALHSSIKHPYAAYLMPLLVYCTSFLFIHDSIFMYPWFVASFSICFVERHRKSQMHALWKRTMAQSQIQSFEHRRA